MFNARNIAIVVVAVVSGASFTLGFFVGKATSRSPMIVETAPPPEFRTETESVFEEPAEVKPSPTAPLAGEKPAVAGKVYCIQAGAFSELKDAQALKVKLKTRGYDAYVQRSRTDDKTVYRVRVGRFRNRKDADLLALKLKKVAGVDTFVTSRN